MLVVHNMLIHGVIRGDFQTINQCCILHWKNLTVRKQCQLSQAFCLLTLLICIWFSLWNQYRSLNHMLSNTALYFPCLKNSLLAPISSQIFLTSEFIQKHFTEKLSEPIMLGSLTHSCCLVFHSLASVSSPLLNFICHDCLQPRCNYIPSMPLCPPFPPISQW
jgi:hypothetical protein